MPEVYNVMEKTLLIGKTEPTEYITIGKRKYKASIYQCRHCQKLFTSVPFVTTERSTCGCIAANTKHGHFKINNRSIIIKAWSSMKTRCYSKHGSSYKWYGGRGITVCDRWLNDPITFIKDMSPHPGKGYSLDRIDVNGNYEPDNCRWITMKEQQRNRTNNILINYKGETHCVKDWANIFQVDYSRMLYKIKKYKTMENALNNWMEDRVFKDTKIPVIPDYWCVIQATTAKEAKELYIEKYTVELEDYRKTEE